MKIDLCKFKVQRPEEIIEVIKQTRALLDDEQKWVQGLYYAYRDIGAGSPPTVAHPEQANCWCLSGAIEVGARVGLAKAFDFEVSCQYISEVSKLLLETQALFRTLLEFSDFRYNVLNRGYTSIESFNDDTITSFEEIQAFLNFAEEFVKESMDK